MAKNPNQQRPSTRTMKIPYRESPSFVSAYVDGGVVTGRHDEIGSMLQILFTRLEASMKSEEFPITTDGIVARQTAQSTFTQEEVKIAQFIAFMRPDQALGIATAIITHLNQMPENLKTKYNIPKFETPAL